MLFSAIRGILPQLMAWATNRRRYMPKAEWSRTLWTHNVFMVYHLIFGKACHTDGNTIRPAFAVWQDVNGKVHRKSFTIEQSCAFFESDVRALLNKIKSARLVRVPVYIDIPVFAGVGSWRRSYIGYSFAIAFGAYTKGTGSTSPNTLSVTTSGSDRWLNSSSFRAANAQTVTGTTYAAVACTQGVADTSTPNTGYYGSDVWYIDDPTTGANNLVTSWTGGGNIFQYALGYTGVVNSGISVQSAGDVTISGGNVIRSVTPSAANGWLCWFGSGDGSFPTGIYNSYGTSRASVGSDWGAADSNGTQAASAVSLGFTVSSGAHHSLSVLGFGIATASGPTNLKTWNGLAKASVKTINGLAIASTKTVNGLT